ncbi:hypothetical protein F444_12658 [Phytophthora nicotianae P1976]|uniref:BED-type domain-containing protein n=1 Tax=Phytophthora nicotianae P1976 TaxID=1317066 RepID=A0A080ZWA0_PHYNI|nr:hypothetical protein F444_12658 [Phytophthora nicotianae P1976]
MALNKASFSTSSIPEEVLFFFDVEVVDKNITYQCRKCPSKARQMWKTGYSNLRKHLVSCVGSDYMEKFTTSKKAQVNPLGFTREKYITDKEFSVFRWLEWVVMRNMPLSEVDNPLKRSLAGHGSIPAPALPPTLLGLSPLLRLQFGRPSQMSLAL